MTTEYMLVEDDDGHWYVIPSDKLVEFAKWCNDLHRFWKNTNYTTDQPPPPPLPEWANEVGGSYLQVKFTGFRIDNPCSP